MTTIEEASATEHGLTGPAVPDLIPLRMLKPKYGKPSLALDMMEPFRPVIAESVVVTAINNGEVSEGDFIERTGGVYLKPEGRRRFVATYERRVEQEVKHPVFGYRCTYRRIFELEARLLGRWLTGEIPRYVPFQIR